MIQSNELESSKTQIFKLLKLALSDIINIDTKINAYILNSSDLFCMSQPFIACICAVTIPNSYHTSESSMRTCKYIRERQSFVQCDAVIIKFYVVFTQHVSDKWLTDWGFLMPTFWEQGSQWLIYNANIMFCCVFFFIKCNNLVKTNSNLYITEIIVSVICKGVQLWKITHASYRVLIDRGK